MNKITEEKNKDRSGIEVGRDTGIKREMGKIENRTAYQPIGKSLKTKIIDPDSTEKTNLEKLSDNTVFDKRDYICKKCGKPYPTPKEALTCYDKCYEWGTAVHSPIGFKPK